MLFFKEKVCIYRGKGNKKEWKDLKAALKAEGLKVSSHFYEDEMPVCGCGGRVDVRNFGPNGKIDRTIYDLCVRKEEQDVAEAVRDRMLPGYVEYVTEEC